MDGRASAAAALLLFAATVAGCGGSGSTSTQANFCNAHPESNVCSSTTPAAKPTKPVPQSPVTKPQPTTTSSAASSGPSGCITTNEYGGLYSTVAAFNANNNMTQPSQPLLGDAVYHVLSTAHGCVSGYSIDELTQPPQGARDIAVLTDGIALPIDNRISDQSGGCLVFSSATLTRSSGFEFARADGTGQSGSTPAHAEIHLTNSGSC